VIPTARSKAISAAAELSSSVRWSAVLNGLAEKRAAEEISRGYVPVMWSTPDLPPHGMRFAAVTGEMHLTKPDGHTYTRKKTA